MSTYSENIHMGDHVENRIVNPYCNSCSTILNCSFNYSHWWTCKNWVIEDHQLEIMREHLNFLPKELLLPFQRPPANVWGMPDEIVKILHRQFNL